MQILTKMSSAERVSVSPPDFTRAACVLAEGLLFHAREECFDDADLDVGLEEAQPHLAKRGFDVLLVELGEPGETVSSLAKPFRDRVEHGAKKWS